MTADGALAWPAPQRHQTGKWHLLLHSSKTDALPARLFSHSPPPSNTIPCSPCPTAAGVPPSPSLSLSPSLPPHLPHGRDLRVRRGVRVAQHHVVTAGDHLSVAHHHGAKGPPIAHPDAVVRLLHRLGEEGAIAVLKL